MRSVFHWHCMGQHYYIWSGSLTCAPCLASVVIPPQLSKAVAWHVLRVWPLWWCPNFWLFQDSQCWLPWWKWDRRSLFHWHCMGQCCCSLVMKLTGFCPLLLLYYYYTETYFKKTANNGRLFKHGVSWQSTLNGPWGYWAITLQCLLTV